MKRLCRVLQVWRSGFYRWRKETAARLAHHQADEQLAEQVRRIHAEHDGTYDSPRMTAELRAAGMKINHKRMERVMREHGIAGLRLRKKVRTTIAEPDAAPVPDLILVKSKPQTNKKWTDSGETHDDRGLRHRADEEGRPVPIPPELVAILREHITEFGVYEDGRLFRTSRGGVISIGTYCEAWKAARVFALTPEQQASPLAARPYDLRHAAVSLWLNAGVAAPDVADRAGHGVDVLLKVYAKCLDGGEEIANRRIEDALAA